MKAKELKKSMKSILETPYAIQIYLVIREKDDFSIKLADIESTTTIPELKELFQFHLTDEIINNDSLSLQNLSAADERSNVVYFYDYDEYPEELDLIRKFELSEAIAQEKFNFKTDELSKLHGFLIYLGSMNKGMLLFKKHYPISLIKRDAFLLYKSENRFKKFDGSDIIRINGNVQLIKLNDHIYITDLKVLEKNFGFDKLIHSAAEEAISIIEEYGLLEDIEVLKDTAEELAFARKLSKVKTNSPIFNLNIPKENVLEFTRNTPELAGKFKYSDDGKKIRLDTNKSKKEFIKLLNDAFLHSELTKVYYDARAKDVITKE